MTAVSFIEKLTAYDQAKQYHIQVFSEEDTLAYNRVGLTQYFGHQQVEKQWMNPREWYDERGVTLHLGKAVDKINAETKQVHHPELGWVPYDVLVLATGSNAALPPGVPIYEMDGIFVYRTLQDLDGIIAWASQPHVKTAAIVGGGLLGLEAARAAKDLNMEKVTIYERSDRLMARQLDTEASETLEREIHAMGLETCIGHCPMNLHGVTVASNVNSPPCELPKPRVATLTLDDDRVVNADMVIYSIGIVPRDQLAKQHPIIERGARGGFKVNEYMETSVTDIYAIGECAAYNDMCYGLVAPCYDMADIVAKNLTSKPTDARVKFKGADMSTKLKLLGVQVASFGDCFADLDKQKYQPLVYRDPFAGIYKKYIFTKDGKKVVGGIMVGDSKDYGKLLSMVKNGMRLKTPPSELILGVQKGDDADQGAASLPDDTQICSCNNITKGQIRQVIRENKCENVNQVKCQSKAGTGCGGCLNQVQEIFEVELKSLGRTVTNSLCRHFKYNRAELFTIGKAKELHSFADFVREASVIQDQENASSTAIGCEICKPTIASILASLWNDHILDDNLAALQDTNDRYLANIQRGGLYSVVPRIAAGEISPEKLKVIAEVALEHNLYTKITGAQRIDMMGAHKQELPDIWEKLVDAGFESGHAYGKSLRAVKSCVGTSWCRYGQQDSVSFAILLENRYKGIRSPHKLKGGVSGCIRECAEARGKDFGCIATDKGYNVYVCGNGGSTPKHAELLVADAPEDKVIKYLDRFLMYYIMTADRLMRTARWLEKLEGGMAYLRKVVIEDYLGIGDALEVHMHQLIAAYQCEWTTVVKDPKRRAYFQSFANAPGKPHVMIEMMEERGQTRPVNWPKTLPNMAAVTSKQKEQEPDTPDAPQWVAVGNVAQFPSEAGHTVLIGEVQIAVFRTQGKWYATQNMCPHKRALVLSSGLLGTDAEATPYVSCPMHKKNFDLESGKVLGDTEPYQLSTFDVKVEADQVFLKLPSEDVLNTALGSSKTIINRTMTPKVTPKIMPMAPSCSVGGGCGDKSLDW
ncbi:hypothetical protein BC940DRAFT_254993 [Gongronella butleri]|nr:hypothetical protein BC940DRAFT_254993 [Gongronella butleri]